MSESSIHENNIQLIKILLNEDVEINVVSYNYVVAQNMKSLNDDFFISSFLNDASVHYYDAYFVIIQLKNS